MVEVLRHRDAGAEGSHEPYGRSVWKTGKRSSRSVSPASKTKEATSDYDSGRATIDSRPPHDADRFDGSLGDSPSSSLKALVSHPIPTHRSSISQSFDHVSTNSTSQVSNQPTKQPSHQSTNQPSNQPISQPIHHSTPKHHSNVNSHYKAIISDYSPQKTTISPIPNVFQPSPPYDLTPHPPTSTSPSFHPPLTNSYHTSPLFHPSLTNSHHSSPPLLASRSRLGSDYSRSSTVQLPAASKFPADHTRDTSTHHTYLPQDFGLPDLSRTSRSLERYGWNVRRLGHNPSTILATFFA